MLHGNVLLHGWWVTDVSFLTAELPQYALVIAAAGLHPEVVHICAAMTYTLLVLLAAYVARGRSSGAEAVVRALIAAGIILAPEPGVASWILLSDPTTSAPGCRCCCSCYCLTGPVLPGGCRPQPSPSSRGHASPTRWRGGRRAAAGGGLPGARRAVPAAAPGALRRSGTRCRWPPPPCSPCSPPRSRHSSRRSAGPDQQGRHRAHPARQGVRQRPAGHSQRAGAVRRRFPGCAAGRPGDQPRVRGRAPGGAGARPRGGRGGGMGADRVAGLAGSRPRPAGGGRSGRDGATASRSATWCQT